MVKIEKSVRDFLFSVAYIFALSVLGTLIWIIPKPVAIGLLIVGFVAGGLVLHRIIDRKRK